MYKTATLCRAMMSYCYTSCDYIIDLYYCQRSDLYYCQRSRDYITWLWRHLADLNKTNWPFSIFNSILIFLTQFYFLAFFFLFRGFQLLLERVDVRLQRRYVLSGWPKDGKLSSCKSHSSVSLNFYKKIVV